MVSLDDVARAAGVSTATASRALSGRGRTSERTRVRVRSVADALGYVASAPASSLASGRAENIGVLVPLMDRWFFATVLDGIASRLAAHGYDVTLYNVSEDPVQRRRLFETTLRRGRVDGIVVISVVLSDDEAHALRTIGLPVVGLGVPRGDVGDVGDLGGVTGAGGLTGAGGGLRVDDTAVGRAATAHLLSLGHRRIAHIGRSIEPGGPTDPAYDIPSRRRAGFEAAMRDAGVRGRFVAADFTVEGGRRAAAELLSGPDRPTAIFAASDEMAFGALTAARDAGLRVPDDVSVIGVDGHDLAELFSLTTIDQFPHAQGERAAEAILAAVGAGAASTDPPAAPEPLLFSLVTRGTTGPPHG